MVPYCVLVAVMTAHGQPTGQPPTSCCERKTVGGISYTLTGQMDTQAYNCDSDCVYQKDGEPGMQYCFATGDMEVECKDGEMGGSANPPMGQSEKNRCYPGSRSD
jgi:hypothetical protein